MFFKQYYAIWFIVLYCFLIGQIIKDTEGRLNLQTLNKLLGKRLLNE